MQSFWPEFQKAVASGDDDRIAAFVASPIENLFGESVSNRELVEQEGSLFCDEVREAIIRTPFARLERFADKTGERRMFRYDNGGDSEGEFSAFIFIGVSDGRALIRSVTTAG